MLMLAFRWTYDVRMCARKEIKNNNNETLATLTYYNVTSSAELSFSLAGVLFTLLTIMR